MGDDQFKKDIKNAAESFMALKKKHIKIVSHLDCDGLTAAAIIIKAFLREKLDFSVSIVKQLDSTVLEELSKENYNCYFFTDLGSAYITLLEQKFPNKTIFVLDHHKPEKVKNKICHINPHLYGIDGGKDISGAGVTYFFAKELDQENKNLAYLALIGAIGDVQEKKGFTGLNQEILNDAVASGKIEVKKGLSMFGMQTKPLHKVLEFSTDPYIPGVTGNEKGAIKFLNELGISVKDTHGKYKKLVHLDNEDIKKLITGIILRRLGSEKNPDDILGWVYLLKDEEEESPTKDAREFSTLLNSCGRMRKPAVGIGTCLGNKRIKREALDILSQYREELIKALNWFYSNRGTDKVIEQDGYTMINAEENVPDTIIGTLASILSRANLYREGTIILSIAHTLDGNAKASLRLVGINPNMDLREILSNITKKIGGEAGGHKQACGCIITQEKLEDFLKFSEESLKKHVWRK